MPERGCIVGVGGEGGIRSLMWQVEERTKEGKGIKAENGIRRNGRQG